jgi:hypothetical protein
MKILLNDIWTRRERKDKRLALWISEDVLVSDVKGTTEKYLWKKARPTYKKTVKKRFQKQDIMPDTGANFRYGKKDGKFFYDFDRLPEWLQKALGKTKEEIIAYHAAIPSMEARGSMADDMDAYLEDYARFLPAYGSVDEFRAKELAKACAIVQYAADTIGRQAPTGDNTFYRDLAAILKERGIRSLPNNYRRLKDKITPVIDGADVRKIIKLPRAGNANSKKEVDARVIAWLIQLRHRGENFTRAHIIRKVRKMCPLVGITPPSGSWMDKYLAQYHIDFITGSGRYGKARRGSAYTPYIPIEGALHAGDCWQMDGTRFNFIPHDSFDKKQRSLIIIAVRDVHSGEMLGYHFDTKEDRYGYIHALGMAVAAKGHLPYELVHDKFPGHNTEEWQTITRRINHLGVKTVISSKATAKAAVERGFGTLQDVFMIESKYYYGHGIQSSRDYAHRSPEYLAKTKREANREGFDFDMAAAEATRVVQAHNHTKYSEYSRVRAKVEQTPNELYTASEKPWAIEVDEFKRVEIFGLEKKATIRNNGLITIEIQAVKFFYQLTDYNIISTYKQVRVCYDPGDLTNIYVFDNDDDANRKFLCTVTEQKAVKYYGPEADHHQMGKIKKKHKELKERRAAQLEEMTAEASDLDVLMAATNAKTTTDDAQDAWILERMGTNKDKRHNHTPNNLPLAPAAAPELVTVEDEDYDELDITSLPRMY